MTFLHYSPLGWIRTVEYDTSRKLEIHWIIINFNSMLRNIRFLFYVPGNINDKSSSLCNLESVEIENKAYVV